MPFHFSKGGRMWILKLQISALISIHELLHMCFFMEASITGTQHGFTTNKSYQITQFLPLTALQDLSKFLFFLNFN